MIYKETNDEYNLKRGKDWISPSDIECVRTPHEFRYKRSMKPIQKDYLDIGHAFHTAVLESKKFNDEVTYVPNDIFPNQKFNKDGSISLSAKGNGEVWRKFQEENPDKIILKEASWKEIKEMVFALKRHPGYYRLMDFKKAYIEQSFYTRYIWNKNGTFERIESIEKETVRDSDLILLVRTKADFVHKKRLYSMDLKTTIDASPFGFSREAAKFQYDIQGSLVNDIVSACTGQRYETFIFFVIEKKTNQVAMYDVASQDLYEAESNYLRRLNNIRKAINEQKYAGYEFYSDNEYGLISLKLPDWYKIISNNSKF